MLTHRLANLAHRTLQVGANNAIKPKNCPLLYQQAIPRFNFSAAETEGTGAKSKTTRAKKSTSKKPVVQKKKTNSVYLWSKMPRMAVGKGGSISTNLSLPKGEPQRITEFDELNVQKLCVGLRHSAVLSEDGKVYTYGNGNHGILGHGDEKTIAHNKAKPVQRLENHKVVDIALGEYHSLALTEDGNLWSWGYGGKKSWFNKEAGGLGHGDVESRFTPKKVAFFEENGLKVQ